MKYALLHQFETLFKRSPFKAVEDVASLSADEQRWFVWVLKAKDEPELKLTDVEEWTVAELTEAISDFFGGIAPSIPS
jgi:hypothetical protein